MDEIVRTLSTRPWSLLTWPALAMLAGTLLRLLLGKHADRLSIVPRSPRGLVGIATAPFIHNGFAHVLANLPPFLVLGALVLRRGEPIFLRCAILVALGSGVLVWLLGRKAAHMGASGVVFGFFGYLVTIAYVTRGLADLVIAVLVVIVYGSMLVGIKPARNGTSWEAHLFGLLAGVAAACLRHF